MYKTNTPQLKLKRVSLYESLPSRKKDNQLGYAILKDVSFEVCRGEIVAILGAVGSGKTSLLRLLNRLEEYSSGDIYWDDKHYRHVNVMELRHNIVLLAQEPRLLGMTVRQALTYPMNLRGLPKQNIDQRVDEYAEKLRIPNDWMTKTEVQLSVGQRQLIAIARALIIKPQVLLLDEPISSLDAESSEKVIEVLLEMNQTDEITILMTSHQVNYVQNLCTRAFYLEGGRLIIDDSDSNTKINWIGLKDKLSQAQACDEFNF